MASRDVRDILSLPAASSSTVPAPRKRAPKTRAPRNAGISKELYALIGDNASPLALAAVSRPKFKDKIKETGQQKAIKWHQKAFTNEARKDGLQLMHWVKSVGDAHVGDLEPYKFAKYNTSSNPLSYSSEEYLHHLRDENWTREETDYLFSLLSTYDLRFPIVHDRYDYATGPPRSMETLKSRYYSTCKKLISVRPSVDETERQSQANAYNFDSQRETERKSHVATLLWRSPAQIAEEDFLYIESRRLEQNAQRLVADRENLMATLDGMTKKIISGSLDGHSATNGNLVVPPGTGALSATTAAGGHNTKRNSHRRPDAIDPSEMVEPLSAASAGRKVSRSTLAADTAQCVFRFDGPAPPQYPPVTLRSSRVAAPKPTLAPRVIAILTELGMPTTGKGLVVPTRANVTRYEELQSAAAVLVELKRQVDRVDSEIAVMKKKKEDAAGRHMTADSITKRSPSVSSVGSAAQSRKRPRRG